MRSALYLLCAALLAQDGPKPELPPQSLEPKAASAEVQETPRAPPPKLEFTGKPITAPFACSEERLNAIGLSCPESEPCEVYLELSSVEAAGDRLIVAGNLHSAGSTFSSILLTSEDGGTSWIEAHERIPSAVLEGIQFIDASNGWVSGQVLTALPRDPFFLVTSDGGKTWRQRPLFDETRVAAIDSFYFDSRTDGELLLDRSRSGEPASRSEIYATKTGGDTWMLREVSGRELKLKKTRPVSADLRLRVDAPSSTYRVERRRGQQWALLSSFAVRLPDCKIASVQLTPPPEPEVPPPAASKPTGPRKPPALKKN